MILEGEIKDKKMSSFLSDFQTFIKHLSLLYFLYEVFMSLRSFFYLSLTDAPCSDENLHLYLPKDVEREQKMFASTLLYFCRIQEEISVRTFFRDAECGRKFPRQLLT